MREKEEKPRIMIVSGVPDKEGGSNAALIENIQCLKEKYDFLVIVPSEGSFSRQLRILNIHCKIVRTELLRGKSEGLSNLKFIARKYKRLLINLNADRILLKIIKQNHINLIHINISATNVGVLAAIISKRPLLWHLRELNDIDQNAPLYFPNLMRTLFKHSNLVAISKFVKSYYQFFLGDNKDILLLQDGIATEELTQISNLPDNKPDILKLLFLGGYQFHKGLDTILNAVKIVHEKNFKIELTVYGSQYNKNVAKYNEFVKKNRLQNIVIFHSFTDNIVKAFDNTDVVISASLEAFGRVAAQGIVSGRIVIGENAGATPELINDGKNGYLFKENSYNDLSDKIIEVIKNWNILTKSIVTERTSSAQKLSSKRTAKELDKLYQRLIVKD